MLFEKGKKNHKVGNISGKIIAILEKDVLKNKSFRFFFNLVTENVLKNVNFGENL